MDYFSRPHAACLLLALAGCQTVPLYRAGHDTPMVPVTVHGDGTPYACIDGIRHRLPTVEKNGRITTEIPAGQRLTLWSSLADSDYKMSPFCKPALSLTPAAGTRLILNSGLDHSWCFIEVVREDEDRVVGVAPEPTLGEAECRWGSN